MCGRGGGCERGRLTGPVFILQGTDHLQYGGYRSAGFGGIFRRELCVTQQEKINGDNGLGGFFALS